MLTKIKKIIDFSFTYKFVLLLFTLVAQIFIPVFFEDIFVRDLLSYLFISLTLFVSILIFKKMKRHKLFIWFGFFVLLVILFNWLDFFVINIGAIQIPRIVLLGVLYLIVFVNIFKEFGKRKEVDIDFIFGAISAYLILGLISSFISLLIDFYYPGSYTFSSTIANFSDHVYFNFVTLTTLGYGDVLPLSPQGKMQAIAVALIGQLYLTITIAMIVGRYLMRKTH